MAQTKIEWTDFSDNVFVIPNGEKGKHGWFCEKLSAGCTNCYAEQLNLKKRFNYGTGLKYIKTNRPNRVEFRTDICNNWLKMKKTKVHFVNSMTDTFLEIYPPIFIKALFKYMNDAKNQIFVIVTKRPKAVLKIEKEIKWTDNIILMISAEDQKSFEDRINYLYLSKAQHKGISAEPLLGKIDFEESVYRYITFIISENILGSLMPLHWIIAGGESGKNSRPMDPEFVYSLKEQADKLKIPFFFKQWGNYKYINGNFVRMSKKAAGRLLDGQQVNGQPYFFKRIIDQNG